MTPNLIVMLTHHDQTVNQASSLFESLKDTPVQYWGFKDVGLLHDRMRDLVQQMKDAGKTTFLEVVSLTEAEGLVGANLAIEAGFDILMGTVYYDSIRDLVKTSPVKYYPFPGHVYSHPSILDGSIDQIVAHARLLQSYGVDGLDLLAYRFTGDAFRLLQQVVQATQIPVVSAGSIDSLARIDEVCLAKPWGFTIGSAFFEEKFIPGGSFRRNMLAVWDWLEQKPKE